MVLTRAQGRPLDTSPMSGWIGRAMQSGINQMEGIYLHEVTSKRLRWYASVVSDSVN